MSARKSFDGPHARHKKKIVLQDAQKDVQQGRSE
jgi:hypothetical protein